VERLNAYLNLPETVLKEVKKGFFIQFPMLAAAPLKFIELKH
jgi:hypothetical protein